MSLVAASCILDRQGIAADTTGGGASSSGDGGAAASSGAGGMTTSSTGSGASPGTENCLNGSDDDGDNMVDCDDPDCMPDYQCVPSATEANGYLSQLNGADACPAETTTVTMSACACSDCTATNGTCDIEISIDDDNDCNSPFVSNTNGQCNDGPPSNSTRYFELVAISNNNNGSCSPQGSASAPPTTMNGCETLSPGSCSNGGVCVRRPANAQRDCIRITAGTQCPGDYPQLWNGFEGTPAGNCDCDCSNDGSNCAQPYVTTHEFDGCGGNMTTTNLTLNQCSGAVTGVSAFYVPDLEAIQTCTQTVTLPGTTAGQMCCTN